MPKLYNLQNWSKMMEVVEKLSKEKVFSDSPDFNPYEFSCGNFDDCFQDGVEDGKILLAKELMDMFNVVEDHSTK